MATHTLGWTRTSTFCSSFLQGIALNRQRRDEISVLVEVVEAYVNNKDDRYPRFGGMCWIFLKGAVHSDLINWTDSLPFCAIDTKALLAFWCSTDVDAHDAVGVFGCHAGQNTLDLGKLFQEVDVQMVDRNRTGYTSALYVALVCDANILKLSETRVVKLFNREGADKPVQMGILLPHLRDHLTKLLGVA